MPSDSVYLSYHVNSHNDLEDFTDIDVKEILCPMDMNNFYKHNQTAKQTFYKQSSFPQETKSNTQTQAINFLGKTYQKMYDKPASKLSMTKKENKGQSSLQVDRYTIINNQKQPSVIERNSFVDNTYNNSYGYGNLYIDNFTSSQFNPNLQINHLTENHVPNRPQY